jgi:Homeodomain-like domain
MRHVVPTVAAIRFALATRRDLLLECLALRHQLGVLGRSNRRFRPSDRLLWLILRRVWSRWRDALMLVEPATVDRWHADGFYRCWRRRLRRPGRPRIDFECRGLIRQMAAENRLWGAPRIHGELLKLGITVSERTVSRYLQRDRLMAPSQTWRTFLANHIGQLGLISPVTSPCAPHVDEVIDISDQPFCHPPSWNDESLAAQRCVVVDWCASLQRTSCGAPTVQDVRDTMAVRNRTSRGPPTAWIGCGRLTPFAGRIVPLHWTSATKDRVRRLVAGRLSRSSSTPSETSSFGCAVRVYLAIRTVVGILARHSLRETSPNAYGAKAA